MQSCTRHEGEHERNTRYSSSSAGAGNLFGRIKYTHAELLRSSTGKNVIKSTQCSEEEKLEIQQVRLKSGDCWEIQRGKR